MLNLEEIQQLMEEDRISDKKNLPVKGRTIMKAIMIIKGYRLFYYNADGNLVEDKTRSNVKLPMPFLPNWLIKLFNICCPARTDL